MTHDQDMLDLCEIVADGHTNACDDQIQQLATWALLQVRELELERQQRHAAETDRNALATRLGAIEAHQRQADESWCPERTPLLDARIKKLENDVERLTLLVDSLRARQERVSAKESE